MEQKRGDSSTRAHDNSAVSACHHGLMVAVGRLARQATRAHAGLGTTAKMAILLAKEGHLMRMPGLCCEGKTGATMRQHRT